MTESDELNWEKPCVDLLSLLDAVEAAEHELERLGALIHGRFRIIQAHGLEIEIMSIQATGLQ